MSDKTKPETPPAKKRTTRKLSPVTIAGIAFKEREKLNARLADENERHAVKVRELQLAIERHDQHCELLPPEARELFERLVGS